MAASSCMILFCFRRKYALYRNKLCSGVEVPVYPLYQWAVVLLPEIQLPKYSGELLWAKHHISSPQSGGYICNLDGIFNAFLAAQEADLAAAPLTRTQPREEVVDFTYPIMSAKMTVLIRRDVEADTIEDLIENTGG